MTNELYYSKVYQETGQAYEDGYKIIIHKGGTGSGKSYELMLFLITYFNTFNKNKIITIISESLPHLKIGVMRYMDEILIRTNKLIEVNINKSDHTYKFKNGNIFEFFSSDRIGKAIGARRHVLYGNEINNLKLDVWDEMARRSEYIYADFNPTSQFWLEKWLLNYDKHIIINSNYLDNPFLPDYEKERISKRAERDANFRRIHIDCEYGIYEGLVFTEFVQVDEFPDVKILRFGIDFGYTNDPTAIVKVGIKDECLFVDEMLYRKEMLNTDIAKFLNLAGVKKQYDEIYADSAEPKSIEEIKRHGYNVKPSVKGADSIISGIDKIKTYRLHVTKRSINLIKELRNYSWVVDKTGEKTNKPIDMWNHAIDATRYALSNIANKKQDIKQLQNIFY